MGDLHYALSDKEMLKLLPDKTKIVTYDELMHLNDIDEILYPTGCCVILYFLKSSSGHWSALHVTGDILNFFCSYGLLMDSSQFDNVSKEVMEAKNQTKKYLTQLIAKSRYKRISYNDEELQAYGVATCGRYCVLRIWLRFLNDKDFDDFMRSKRNPDKFSIILTNKPLKELKSKEDVNKYFENLKELVYGYYIAS